MRSPAGRRGETTEPMRRVGPAAIDATVADTVVGGRMRFPISTLVFGVLLTIAADRGLAADVDAGKTAFKKCALCHTTEAGKNKIGPSLFGIVGRKSASLENFNYSDGMKKFEHAWDEQTLDLYLADPRGAVPGTKMILPASRIRRSVAT
jgi:cytochrome c